MPFHRVSDEPIRSLDGYTLRRAFEAGTQAVVEAREHLNRINVFPVADADTGSNLAATLVGALAEADHSPNLGATMRSLADAALMQSVGNSGIIMAQFLDGLAEAVGERRKLPLEDLAEVAACAIRQAERAVSEPLEGTMLTVMRVWAETIQASSPNPPNLDTAFAAAEDALRATRTQLPALAEAGLVDAGAAGFVCFLRGLQRGLRDSPALGDAPTVLPQTQGDQHRHLAVPDAVPVFRYCTEIVVEEARADVAKLRADLTGLGDSLIVAGHGRRLKVHVHCNQPEEVAARLARHGRLGRQKVDDMQLQHAAHHCRLAEVALVTDTACDLPRELLDRWQIHQVPLSIQWGADQYLDRYTLSAQRFYALLDQRREAPRTSQPSPQRFERLYRSLADCHREVLSVHLSGKLSGTLDTARLAASRLGDTSIRVVDGRLLTTGLGLVVWRTAEAIAEGAGAAAAATLVESLARRTEVMVAVQSLDSMIRGGRVSPLKGFVARSLGLLPIISLDREGRSCVRGKAFSFAGAVDHMLRRLADRRKQSIPERWAISHADAEVSARQLEEGASAILDGPPAYVMETSPIIGAHAGTGSVCISVQWSDPAD